MAVVEKVFITLHCHIALIGSFGRHIEESAFRLFLLRKLDTYKSNIGMSKKDALLVCIRISRNTSKQGCSFSLSILREVQPYIEDKGVW